MSGQLFDFMAKLPSVGRSVAAGAHLFHVHDRVTNVYWIEEGIAHLLRYTSDGTPIVMQRARCGTLLAEASIFAERYHCDAVAIEAVRVMQFARSDVRQALQSCPDFAATLAEHLATEVMKMRTRSEIASFRTVAERLDAWLGVSDGRLPARGKRRHLATELGVTPEALYRELARRGTAGIPRVQRHRPT